MLQKIAIPFTQEEFNIKVEGEYLLVTRSYTFNQDESVSFVARLKRSDAPTLADVHQKSIAVILDHLKALSGQQ